MAKDDGKCFSSCSRAVDSSDANLSMVTHQIYSSCLSVGLGPWPINCLH